MLYYLVVYFLSSGYLNGSVINIPEIKTLDECNKIAGEIKSAIKVPNTEVRHLCVGRIK